MSVSKTRAEVVLPATELDRVGERLRDTAIGGRVLDADAVLVPDDPPVFASR